MREIKFRAWNELRKKMFKPFSLYEYVNGNLDYDKEVETSPVFPVGTVFLQFTGLKDKNGKEIYEGDILERKTIEERCKVIYLDGCFALYPIPNNGDIYHCWMISDEEVIGNIYENPELLEGEKP